MSALAATLILWIPLVFVNIAIFWLGYRAGIARALEDPVTMELVQRSQDEDAHKRWLEWLEKVHDERGSHPM